MENIYFNPGCGLRIYKPDMEQKLLKYVKEVYNDVKTHTICCKHEPKLEAGSIIINVCAGCDKRFSSLYEGVATISLWEVLDNADVFPYPDYGGIKMSVQDACPIREKPQVHAAVRSLLHKMNIEIIETEKHGENSVCCGDNFYPALELEQIHNKMKERAQAMPCNDVAVYCVSCIKAIFLGGKSPRYLVDLLFDEKTTPEIYDTIEWHNQLQSYIDAH